MSKRVFPWVEVGAWILVAYCGFFQKSVIQYRLFWLSFAALLGVPMWLKIREDQVPMGRIGDWNITRAANPITYWCLTILIILPVPLMIAGAIFLPKLKP